MSENSKDVTGYWTPEDFRNYGLKLEAAFPLYKKLSANSEIKHYRLRENFGDWGDGNTYSIGLRYGERGSRNFRVNFLDIESKQDGSAWSQDKTTFEYNHSF